MSTHLKRSFIDKQISQEDLFSFCHADGSETFLTSIRMITTVGKYAVCLMGILLSAAFYLSAEKVRLQLKFEQVSFWDPYLYLHSFH